MLQKVNLIFDFGAVILKNNQLSILIKIVVENSNIKIVVSTIPTVMNCKRFDCFYLSV